MLAAHLHRLARVRPVRYGLDAARGNDAIGLWARAMLAAHGLPALITHAGEQGHEVAGEEWFDDLIRSGWGSSLERFLNAQHAEPTPGLPHRTMAGMSLLLPHLNALIGKKPMQTRALAGFVPGAIAQAGDTAGHAALHDQMTPAAREAVNHVLHQFWQEQAHPWRNRGPHVEALRPPHFQLAAEDGALYHALTHGHLDSMEALMHMMHYSSPRGDTSKLLSMLRPHLTAPLLAGLHANLEPRLAHLHTHLEPLGGETDWRPNETLPEDYYAL